MQEDHFDTVVVDLNCPSSNNWYGATRSPLRAGWHRWSGRVAGRRSGRASADRPW